MIRSFWRYFLTVATVRQSTASFDGYSVQAGREYYSLLESSRNNLRTLGQNYTLTVGMQVVSDPTAT